MTFLDSLSKRLLLFMCLAMCWQAKAQNPGNDKLLFFADFRFRVEQDWNSRKSDGSFREDRTRFRYRGRLGLTYKASSKISFGLRLRTGNPIKQQDPQLTLGQDYGEFGTLPIGFEKIYFQYENKGFSFWAGKNTFPFTKNNELFWSDNVFPEGITASKSFTLEDGFINSLKLAAGHFVLGSNNKSLNQDAYIQAIQLEFKLLNKLTVFPTYYFFHRMPNIPDGFEQFFFNYSIIHLGANLKLYDSPKIKLTGDIYQNMADYSGQSNMTDSFKNEQQGYSIGLAVGKLEKAKDWFSQLTYTHLEQYAAVDFLAQNDWARWDYSSFGSPDGRLTNMQGIEFVLAYAIDESTRLTMKYYKVGQLVSYDTHLENGDRIRFDIDIKF